MLFLTLTPHDDTPQLAFDILACAVPVFSSLSRHSTSELQRLKLDMVLNIEGQHTAVSENMK